jgi:hypothetical protein
MKKILAVVAGALLAGTFAASYAKLPPPTPEEKAATAAKAEKEAAGKAKSAKELAKAQDNTVANYKKNKGSSSQGADHAKAKLPDGDLTRQEAQTEMPKPGQANDHSTTARDPQNSSAKAPPGN